MLFIVLIGVMLFAVLSFVITRNSGGFSSDATQEQARLYATEVIQYGNSLRAPVDRLLLLGGVSDVNTSGNGIIFAAADANAAYGVPGTQPSTELFSSTGGRASYIPAPQEACLSACAYEFSGQYTVTGVGLDSKSELVMLLINISKGVCEKANTVLGLGWTSIPSGANLTLTRFDGTNYGDSGGANAITLTGAGNIFVGKRAFCYREPGGSQRYVYLHVLRAR